MLGAQRDFVSGRALNVYNFRDSYYELVNPLINVYNFDDPLLMYNYDFDESFN